MNQITYTSSRGKYNSSMVRSLNILLLGKSGVGKTTFINSFSNYVAYESIDDIHDKNDIKVPIPCNIDIWDDDGKFHNFQMCEDNNRDGNESMDSIKPGTQGCKSYEFDFPDLQINLIDTPGIVDTEGIEKDKKNIEAILDFISTCTSIDGICILLKPNEERLDPALRYCIFQLLCELHKSAAQNICFVFTNAKSTSFKLGSTALAIQDLIKEIYSKKPDLELKFSKENYFLFDSEAFRFLVSKDTVKFDDDDKIMFKQSWNKSRNECVRMMNYISGLPQHNVKNMISINKARRMIENLLKPLVDIADDIMESQQMCQDHELDIIAAEGDIHLLKSKLYVPRTKVIMEYYCYPRLVCNSKNCTEGICDDKEETTHYKKVCYEMHDSFEPDWPSRLSYGTVGVQANAQQAIGSLAIGAEMAAIAPVVGAAAALGAAGLGAIYYYYKMGSCSFCPCLISEHFLSFYETRKIIEIIKDEETLAKMETEENCVVVAESALKNLRQEFEELQGESKIINTASCKFALFLECRAITLYNNTTDDYLNYMIETNKHDHRLSAKDRTAKQMRFKIQKERYQQQKETIKNRCEGSDALNGNEILPEDIDLIVGELRNLKRYGHIFQEALVKIEEMRINENRTRVVQCNVSDSCISLFGNCHAIDAFF